MNYQARTALSCYSSLLSQPDHHYRRSLVLISSLAGCLELDGVDYTASKWAVRGLSRSARPKREDLGYRMNLIALLVVDTPMSKSLPDV